MIKHLRYFQISCQENTKAWVPRAVGLDLMRALAMWFVIIVHIVPHAGFYLDDLNNINEAYRQDALDSRFWGFLGVPMFSILTGYLCVGHKVQSFKLLFFVLLVHFYIIHDVWQSKQAVNQSVFLKLLIPVLSSQYWYAQRYIGLQFMMPILNQGIEHLSNVSLLIASSGIFIFLGLGQLCSMLAGGWTQSEDYSFFLLIGLYVIGATVRRVTEKCKAKYVMPCAALLLWADFKLYHFNIYWAVQSNSKSFFDILTNHASFVTFVGATAMLLFFSKVQIKVPLWLNKLLNRSSFSVFAVYLIHLSPSYKYKIWAPYQISLLPQDKYTIKRLELNCAKIFLKCWLVDWVRQFIFWLLEFKWLQQFCATKIDPYINQLNKPQQPTPHVQEV